MQLISEVRSNNLFIQYDIYHMQIMEGDLARTMQEYLPQISHIQLADSADHVIPGHDPQVLARYPAPAHGLAGIVARLD